MRLTGGEPLLRPDLPQLIDRIRSIPTIRSVGITTNGMTLSRRLPDLMSAGLTHVNVSLDTLREDRFTEITRRKGLDRVLRATDDAVSAFDESILLLPSEDDRDMKDDDDIVSRSMRRRAGRVKINNVVMRGFNDDEMVDFVNMTEGRNLDVRFIEWMPFLDNGWNKDRFFSYKEMLERMTSGGGGAGRGDGDGEGEDRGTTTDAAVLRRLEDGPNDTTKWWSAGPEHKGRVGFITSMSSNFCSSCRPPLCADDCKMSRNSKTLTL